MKRRVPFIVVGILAAVAAAVWLARRDEGPIHYTGFVEGEERIVRSEVSGRILEVGFAEGDAVAAGAIVARLDDQGVRAQIAAKEQEIVALGAEVRRQEEQVRLVEHTWKQDVSAGQAEVRRAASAADLAERSLRREHELVSTGASTEQVLDEARSAREQAVSMHARARDLLGRAEAQKAEIEVARRELEVKRQRRELAAAQLAELRVTHAKYTIRAPAVGTVVQTQFAWPGELAQPGTPVLSVLDPKDKYVQVYVPVADAGRLRVGQGVTIELDGDPGRRVRGEVSFVADQASFTPEKIETRADRLGQVYRVKVRILEEIERFKPGAEGNVYLDGTEKNG